MPPQPATDPHTDSRDGPVATIRRRRWAWIGLLVPLAALGAVVVIDSLTDQPTPTVVGQPAPDFTLPDTTGGTESLDEALTEGSEGVVVYFSMGVGCGGCFAQIPEIADALASHGLRLVSVMVDDAEIARVEAERYGATTPIALDADRTVSQAYGMLGAYGHGDRPSHSFALVGPDRTIREVVHYAEMFVPAQRLLTDLGGVAGG
ncbi:MAG: peroxiredoxin family protein [Actinomycetes bacterium]